MLGPRQVTVTAGHGSEVPVPGEWGLEEKQLPSLHAPHGLVNGNTAANPFYALYTALLTFALSH